MKLYSLRDREITAGTVRLLEAQNERQDPTKSGLVLIPQPTPGDSNDPLNWPRRKRLGAYWSCLALASLANFCVVGLGPAFTLLVHQFDINEFQFTWLLTITAAGMGLGALTIAPLATKFGKRPVWLGCSITFLACNVWAAASPSYRSLLLARFFATWAVGASEPLSMDLVKDLFFLHERGFQSGVLGMAFSLLGTPAPLIGGYLIAAKGWRWYHWLVSILAGVATLLIFFLSPETTYKRDLQRSLSDVGVYELSDVQEQDRHMLDKCGLKESPTHHIERANTISMAITPSYIQQLKPWSSMDPEVSVLGPLIRPWVTFAFPAVCWATLVYAAHVACFIIIVTVTPIYLSRPPYSFTTREQGLTFIGATIGSVSGGLVVGKLNDIVIRTLSRRNKGVFEPEMRLPMTTVPMLATIAGLVLFGVGVKNGEHWIVPVLGGTFVALGLASIPTTLQPYLLDSYFPVSLDVSTVFLGFKNLIVFGFTFGISPWIERNGIASVFGILAAILAVVDLGWVLFYLFGKQWRQDDSKKHIFLF